MHLATGSRMNASGRLLRLDLSWLAHANSICDSVADKGISEIHQAAPDDAIFVARVNCFPPNLSARPYTMTVPVDF